MILSHARLPIPTLPLTLPGQTAELLADFYFRRAFDAALGTG